MSEKWDRRFLALAEHIAQWSKDPSTQVGAVLVNDEGIVTGLGYNGFARGVADTDERLNDRPTKYALVVHAEVNAILMAGDKAKGCTLYVWPSFSIPCICHDCCKTAIQVGVKEVVGLSPTPENAERAKRWQDSIDTSRMMCDEAGVKYREVRLETSTTQTPPAILPDGVYGVLPGDPPGPTDVRVVKGGILYDSEPRTGRLLRPRTPPSGASGYEKSDDGCCHKTVLVRCKDCSIKE